MSNEQKRVDNRGDLRGIVHSVVSQFLENGKAKARLVVKNEESWEYMGETNHREYFITVDFYGKPAQSVMDQDLKKGDPVHIVFKLGSFAAKDKTDVWYTTVNGIVVKLSSHATEAAKTDEDGDMPF